MKMVIIGGEAFVLAAYSDLNLMLILVGLLLEQYETEKKQVGDMYPADELERLDVIASQMEGIRKQFMAVEMEYGKFREEQENLKNLKQKEKGNE